MGRKKPKKNPFLGRWRITESEVWDRDALDEDEPAYIVFEKGGGGALKFIYVAGQLDHRLAERDGVPCVEFTWEGTDEMDPVSGCGWFVIEGDIILGRISIHQGDSSKFVAERE